MELQEENPLLVHAPSLVCTHSSSGGGAAALMRSDSDSGSGLSKPPTEQEIEHMDELDLSINLGSLLGSGEDWSVEDSHQFAFLDGNGDGVQQGAAEGSATVFGDKPFQELFPVSI